MIDIFSILVFFFIILTVSYIFTRFFYPRNLGPFKPVLHALRLVGVLVHELSHFFMCKAVGVKTKSITVRLRANSGRISPNGVVALEAGEREAFLQAFLISMAPLFISTWLFLWSLEAAFVGTLDLFLRIACGIFCICLLLGSTPSRPDFHIIGSSFRNDPSYSLYQVFILIVAGVITWLILFFYDIFVLDFVFYIFVGIMYYIVKYSIRGIYSLVFRAFRISRRFNFSRFNKKRLKPQKSGRIGIRQARW